MVDFAKANVKSFVKKNTERFLAWDTETTGLNPSHGCRAFVVTACDQDGNTYYFEAPVDPKTRKPKWSEETLSKLRKLLLSFKVWVLHHASFDFKTLVYDIPELFDWIAERTIHDTITLAHIFDNLGPKALKELAVLHLNILDDDEQELDEVVKELRKIAPPGWDLGRKGHPHFPSQDKNFHKVDMWLPIAFARFKKQPLKHRNYSVLKRYAINDPIRTAGLFILYMNQLVNNPSFLRPYKIAQATIVPFTQMERTGLHLLPETFGVQREHYTKQKQSFIEEITVLVRRLATPAIRMAILREYKWNIIIEPFVPTKSRHINAIIFGIFKLKGQKKTKSGNWSTDKEAIPLLLESTTDKKAIAFLQILVKLKATISTLQYLETYNNVRHGNYLYPSINVCGTRTTRVSSSDPNGQNVGKGKEDAEHYDEHGNKLVQYSLRSVFGPPTGKRWCAIDYDQLQVRIFAYWSKEPALIHAIENGFDFHDYVARFLFNTDTISKLQRRVAKNTVFGILFGAGENKINRTCGVDGIYGRMLSLFPNVKDTLSRTISQVKQYGYVTTASGYRLYVNKQKAYAGVCYYVQGTEGDIVKSAVAAAYNLVKDTSTQLMFQIHDELLFQYPVKQPPPVNRIAKAMEQCGYDFGVPCKCKPELIIKSWDKPSEYN